jgi:hypothetical protein
MKANVSYAAAARALIVQTSQQLTAWTLPLICWLAVQSCPVQMLSAWAVQRSTALLVRSGLRLKPSTLRPELG